MFASSYPEHLLSKEEITLETVLITSNVFRQVTVRRIAPTLALSLALSATGCADMQNNPKTMLGALGGGAVSSVACLLARGNALTCAAAGIGGAVIGGAIGHAFDERDRARRDAAVQQALYNQSLWQSVPGPLSSGMTTTDADVAPVQAPPTVAKRRRSAAAPVTPATPAVAWQNPDTHNSGAVVPLRTFALPTTGQTCKVYREDYIKDGKQYSDNMQACSKPDGTFDIKPLS